MEALVVILIVLTLISIVVQIKTERKIAGKIDTLSIKSDALIDSIKSINPYLETLHDAYKHGQVGMHLKCLIKDMKDIKPYLQSMHRKFTEEKRKESEELARRAVELSDKLDNDA